ncbi:MAG: hypothetical protein LBN95_09035 [Prevotellaceae bacterium]|jgi:hypothetical protein|nr:hypothetical protein [Prevotellaceae bacterium]
MSEKAKIYIFNPDHELALANNNENFLPKRNIAKLAEDLALLPTLLHKNSYVSISCVNKEWLYITNKLGLNYNLVKEINFAEIEKINIWGWNKNIRKILISKGFNPKILPDDEQLEKIRELTNRKNSIAAMNFVRKALPDEKFPESAKSLSSYTEVEKYAKSNKTGIFKTPFSSSGKGVFVYDKCIYSLFARWYKHALTIHNCILYEKQLDVVQDFAMEFTVNNQGAKFVGYSLFSTKNQAYVKNILMSDEKIEAELEKFVSIELLNAVKTTLVDFINEKYLGHYNGFLGIDMFIYTKNNKYFLNPCVEINLRTTMGIVAHKFYKDFVNNEKTGIFTIDFFKNSEELLLDHIKRLRETPPVFSNNQLQSGYLSLCPIFENTQFRARVEII